MAKLLIYACVTLALTLFISCVSSQVTQCSPKSQTQPKLRFVAQLTVNGCPVFVHDTGAYKSDDSLHLVVEPLMCVTQSLDKVLPRSDLITKQTYVSVPVTMRDDAMLADVQRQLRRLSPKSVKFANVSDVSVSTDASSAIQAFGFDWTPEESTGALRLGCSSNVMGGNGSGLNCSLTRLLLGLRKSSSINDISFLPVVFTIAYFDGTSFSSYAYPLVGQNPIFSDTSFASERYNMRACQLRFVRSIRIGDYTARVHEMIYNKGHFLVEPFLCHNTTGLANEPIVYDYIRDKYYLKMDVVLQDDTAVYAVRSELADLSPSSVNFLRLWSAESVADPALSRQFVIGKLMVSEYQRSGQVRVYCRTEFDCYGLRQQIMQLGSYNLWKYVKWTAKYVADPYCELQSAVSRFLAPPPRRDENYVAYRWTDSCNMLASVKSSLSTCVYSFASDDRLFVTIQQQMTAEGNFQRNWTEYESGFGNSGDFWIGLSAINALSDNGTTLRVEMLLENGTQQYAEFSGFKVGDASTNYTMTYQEMVKNMSSLAYDSLQHHKGMKFATTDVDTAGLGFSCAIRCGRGGWWYHAMECCYFNPTGQLMDPQLMNSAYWAEMPNILKLREVRLLLQIR